MPHFVVTGSAGFIGSRVAQHLLDQGHQVTGIDGYFDLLYPNQPKLERTKNLQRNPNFQFHQADLTNAELEPIVQDAESVFHFAALAGLNPSFKYPEIYAKCNILATERLVSALKNSDAHLIHASTSSVYGQNALGSELEPTDPISPYGKTKLEAEAVVSTYKSATILRYFSVYGPGQRPEMAYAKAIDAALHQKTFTVFGDGTQKRSNTFVTDAAAAAMLASQKRANGTFNICGSETTQLNQALDLIESLTGKPIERLYSESAQGDQLETQGDFTKSKEQLGWEPKVSLIEGLSEQIEYQRGL